MKGRKAVAFPHTFAGQDELLGREVPIARCQNQGALGLGDFLGPLESICGDIFHELDPCLGGAD